METLYYLGAGLAIGLAGFGVAYGEGMVGKKSIETMGKNPELSSFLLVLTILGIALVESAAIYGLIIAFKIAGTPVDSITAMSAVKSISAGLAIGVAGMGVGIGEGMLVANTMDAVLRNPEAKSQLMVYMILFVALVESAAIYGLIVAFNLLS